ncbi:hypothetical protein T552_02496 [Pneumocystis carinii B80]|uniref:Ribosomal RNA-processing protein 44 n=1 Tax=Pneumocystis carinii (strain B80) TaxID=1408658 RepID=A0A0W4ZF50_PNEC8|nr:hypothetical protein T552_02496 [Pneumocystis carinii B80]KTW27004.1 hypothetical protein T552_02496 [Pneumocystis carinii B80]
MFSQDVFIQCRGKKVLKTVRERYLRRDIPCGSQICIPCSIFPPFSERPAEISTLSSAPKALNGLGNGCYVVPDAKVLYYCMSLIEKEGVFNDMIILQTVLEDLKKQSLSAYSFLRQYVASMDKRFYVFHNEFHLETYVERKEEETIRTACKWYVSHLKEVTRGTKTVVPGVLLLTDDKENRSKAKDEGINAYSIEEYLSEFSNSDELFDMITSVSEVDPHSKKGIFLYPEYYSCSSISNGIKTGKLYQGEFNVNPYNFLEANVSVSNFEKPVIILGKENINRAIQGDIVAIEIFKKEQWRTLTSKIIEQETLSVNENAEVEESEEVITQKDQQEIISEYCVLKRGQKKADNIFPTGKVVGIIKRNWKNYVGQIDPKSVVVSNNTRIQQTIFFIPTDKRIPKIRIKTRQGPVLLDQKILVNIDAWDRDSRYPRGHFVRSLGKSEVNETEMEALLIEYDIQHSPFPKSVLDCLPSEGDKWEVSSVMTPSDWEKRRDFRHLPICSIDPPGCVDIDDALHARPLENGNFEVGVHIADVSYFVKPGTAIDVEASERGTTVYLVDKRIDMLPLLLGTNLCSLKPGVERFAFSVIWEITFEAEIVKTEFVKSVIKSRSAFTYEKAQFEIDNNIQNNELSISMKTLLMLSRKLRQKRYDNGALNLTSPELKLEIGTETSDRITFESKKLYETNFLVEEFMLLANISVAHKIYEAYPEFAILRRHVAPPKENFETLRDILKVRRNMILNTESSKTLAVSLDKCVDPDEPYFNTLLRIMVTRCMSSAEYFYAGNYHYSEFRHYGLAVNIYTHWTSPIRRYADIITHRQLAVAIGCESLQSILQDKPKLEKICKNINHKHRMGQMVGRSSIEYYVSRTLEKEIYEDAFVIKVFKNGFVVFVSSLGIEGLVYTRDICRSESAVLFDPESYSLVISQLKSDIFNIDNEFSEGILNIGVFDKCRVKIFLVKESIGRKKINIQFIKKL